MADINVTANSGGTSGHRDRLATNVPYKVEVWIDFADVLATKGTAIAAADVVQALNIPAETYVLAAGLEVETAADSTTLTGDLGYGSNVDVFTDGADLKTTGYGALGTNGKASASAKYFTTADTLDLVLATLTGTLTTGLVRVFAIFLDVSGKPQPVSTQVVL